MKKLLKFVGFVLFFVVFSYVTARLFFPDYLTQVVSKIGFGVDQKDVSTDKPLVIAFSNGAESFEPTKYDSVNRAWMVDVYEGLVRVDENLRVEPSLAISWGTTDDLTWEFKLRPEVRFHDGRTFNAQDVKFSIERAKTFEQSDLTNLLSTITKVEVTDQLGLRVVTSVVDPVLLNKLAAVYVVPDGTQDVGTKPIGTGVYKVDQFDPGKRLVLALASYYWDKIKKPRFQKVELVAISDKDSRIDALLSKKVMFLSQVPPGAVSLLQSVKDVSVVTRPSFEVTFLAFNFNQREGRNIFSNKAVREATVHAIDQKKVIDFTKAYGNPASQFTSRGVFGFDPSIKLRSFDVDKASKLVRSYESFSRLKGSLDLVKGMEVLGDYLTDQFFQIGIDLTVNYHELADLQEKVARGESDFYFLGWRSELGDIGDFYKFVVHSPTTDGTFGRFNAGIFQNKKVDELIEKSEKILESSERIKVLREVMNILVEEDIFGVPLFEPEVIYAFDKSLTWTPRFDGYVIPSSIK